MIPLSVPNLSDKEIEYAIDAIKSEWVSSSGSYISEFESGIAKYLGVDNAVACQSGTAGIHLALICSGVSCSDEVIVPTLTFIAAVNPVRYLNANPIFMDCDESLNMDLEKLEKFLIQNTSVKDNCCINKTTGMIIKAIIVVHIFGNLINMTKVNQLANKYCLKVIEDATEALGGYYTEGEHSNQYAGTLGDFGVFSFNGNKIITTGGGGMLIARSKRDAQRARYLSTQAKDDERSYIHNEIGYNYRMTKSPSGCRGGAVREARTVYRY